ncbi:MAG: hypothetical protein WA985_00280 [Erythrobacter sp.]
MTLQKRTTTLAAAVALAFALAGCAASQPEPVTGMSSAEMDATITRMLAGESETQGEELEQRIAAASAHPLGSKENPVRASGPPGQREYLSRLRCADTSRPAFERAGSAGLSTYGNIVDVYVVTCEGSQPERREIYLDMYHRGHVETRAVPGFGIIGGQAET